MKSKSQKAVECTIDNFQETMEYIRERARVIAEESPRDKSVKKRLQLMAAVQKDGFRVVEVLREVVIDFTRKGDQFHRNLLERCKGEIINVNPTQQAKSMRIQELVSGGRKRRKKKKTDHPIKATAAEPCKGRRKKKKAKTAK